MNIFKKPDSQLDDFNFEDQINDQTLEQPDLIDFNEFGNDVTKQSTYRPSYNFNLSMKENNDDTFIKSLEGFFLI